MTRALARIQPPAEARPADFPRLPDWAVLPLSEAQATIRSGLRGATNGDIPGGVA
jgi:hypothetical protein